MTKFYNSSINYFWLIDCSKKKPILDMIDFLKNEAHF